MSEYSFSWLAEAREQELIRELERRRMRAERAAQAAAATVGARETGAPDAVPVTRRRPRGLFGRRPRHA
ncbi:hypothetical protein VD659_17000 [Herbiconiux sp. 11R-BC]|uniref:hypothetical protein n=1 Tax=Herbiconiux sp. 11R-BC TaxID=3111637 RepID=UPI003C0F9433